MKKILYIVDYLQNEPNSVASILESILALENQNTEKIVVHHLGNEETTHSVRFINGIKTYTASPCSGSKKIIKRFKHRVFGSKDQIQCNIEHLRKIIEIECPDLIFFFLYSPVQEFVKICEDKGIPYIYMLYDTYVGRPELLSNLELAKTNEIAVIEKSIAYFVPSFFFNEYKINYNSDKIISYDLPLLVDSKSVIQSYGREANNYNFSYFGQIQDFRNSDVIKSILGSLNLSLDVFTQKELESDNVFSIHHPVMGEDLYDVVSHSDFLVAFDNSPPYDRYLPSKAYLYVSFTKPIIAFGDNRTSALLEFFNNYPYFYYQNINDSTEGLIEFVNKHYSGEFDNSIYNKYVRYLPKYALSQVKKVMEDVLSA